jgi:hypothetical protein
LVELRDALGMVAEVLGIDVVMGEKPHVHVPLVLAGDTGG